MPKDELRISLSPPRLSVLRSLSQMVEDFGASQGVPASKIYMINLALDELIANSVHYGFDGVADPRIDITMWVSGTLLVLTMVDNGREFDPLAGTGADVSSPLEQRPVGGLGLHLVRTSADRLTHQFADGRNRLTLEHNHAPGRQETEPAEERDMPMDIEVAEERNDDVLVLLPVGRLDSGNARSFESVVMQRISGGEQRLIVDFSRLDFISSSGLRVLLIAAKALKAAAGKLVLCGMKAHIEEVFRISGFDRIIPIKASREAALEAAV